MFTFKLEGVTSGLVSVLLRCGPFLCCLVRMAQLDGFLLCLCDEQVACGGGAHLELRYHLS